MFQIKCSNEVCKYLSVIYAKQSAIQVSPILRFFRFFAASIKTMFI